ncbi:MAG TPA: hypothetical protein VF960_13790 [Chloroflexota bacterium]
MKLEEALGECTLALLRRIAIAHGLAAGEELLRGELSESIAATLLEPGELSSFVGALPEEESAVLSYLSTHGWEEKAFLLDRQFSRSSRQSEGLTACLSLIQKGLLYRSYGAIESWRGEILHVPEELRAPLIPAIPGDAGARRSILPAVPGPVGVHERWPAYEAFSLLSFLRRTDRRLSGGLFSRHDAAELERESSTATGSPVEAEPERRWRFLLRLCLGAGWVRRDRGVLKPGRNAGQLFAGTSMEAERRLRDRYFRDRSWSDLSESGRFRQPAGSRRIDESAARQMVLHHLEETASSSWISEADFVGSLKSTNPDFLREDYDSLASGVVDIAADAELYGADSWDRVEAEWLKFVLRGPFSWLGLVQSGQNDRGASLLRLRRGPAASQPEMEPGIAFLDRETLRAPIGTSLELLLQLEPYLVFRTTEPEARIYRISRASVHHGIDSGGTAPRLLELLRRAESSPSREEGISRAMEWAESYGRLLVEGVLLLTAASEDELLRVEGIPGVAEVLGERIGPLSRRVASKDFWSVLGALREAGYPPRVDPSAGSVRFRGLTADPQLAREFLFSLLLVREIHGDAGTGNAAAAIRTLQALLGPDDAGEVGKQVQTTAKRLRARKDGGW